MDMVIGLIGATLFGAALQCFPAKSSAL